MQSFCCFYIPFPGGLAQTGTLIGDQVGSHRDRPFAANGKNRPRQCILARDQQKIRPAGFNDFTDLHQRTGSLFNADNIFDGTQTLNSAGFHINGSATGNVIKHNGQIGLFRHSRKMLVQPFLSRLVVIGREQQCPIRP